MNSKTSFYMGILVGICFGMAAALLLWEIVQP
jgi:gas vesicle protein